MGREGGKCVGETAHEGVREREGVYALVEWRGGEGRGVGEHMLALNKLLMELSCCLVNGKCFGYKNVAVWFYTSKTESEIVQNIN